MCPYKLSDFFDRETVSGPWERQVNHYRPYRCLHCDKLQNLLWQPRLPKTGSNLLGDASFQFALFAQAALMKHSYSLGSFNGTDRGNG